MDETGDNACTSSNSQYDRKNPKTNITGVGIPARRRITSIFGHERYLPRVPIAKIATTATSARICPATPVR
jgi:hypothetical protein